MIVLVELAQLYVTACVIGLILMVAVILLSIGPILLYPVAKPIDQLLTKLNGGNQIPPPPPWWGPVGALMLLAIGFGTWLVVR